MKKIILIVVVSLILFFFARGCEGRFIPHLSFTQQSVTSQITGYVQTPRGGLLGTSDLKRPRLEELGIERATMPQSRWILRWGNWGIYLGLQPFSAITHPQLETPLITYAEKLPAHTALTVKFQTDLYHFGIFYRGEFLHRRYVPVFEMTFLDFVYGFSQGTLFRTRHYQHIVPSVGWRTYQKQHNTWKLHSAELLSLPLWNGLTVHTQVTETAHRTFLRYRDSQLLPNWVELEQF